MLVVVQFVWRCCWWWVGAGVSLEHLHAQLAQVGRQAIAVLSDTHHPSIHPSINQGMITHLPCHWWWWWPSGAAGLGAVLGQPAAAAGAARAVGLPTRHHQGRHPDQGGEGDQQARLLRRAGRGCLPGCLLTTRSPLPGWLTAGGKLVVIRWSRWSGWRPWCWPRRTTHDAEDGCSQPGRRSSSRRGTGGQQQQGPTTARRRCQRRRREARGGRRRRRWRPT